MTVREGDGRGPGAEGLEPTRPIRRDQLAAVRRSVLIALPVNTLLGLIGTLVAVRAGEGRAGAVWFAAVLAVNLLRAALCRAPCPSLSLRADTPPDAARVLGRGIDRHLRLAWLAALLSGLVWASVPALCGWLTSAQTMFYLAVICGITAGSVTHGTAFARIPIAFIVPPLVSVAGCLVAAGGFDRLCLAATVLLYLLALTRSAVESDAAFREASGLKNEASARAEDMRRLATHDDLTGLLNRAGFLQRAEATPGATCLMLLDLDGFKSVNDVYGHRTGDRVLAEVAGRLRAVLPEGCHAARLGGDEFAVLYEPDRTGIAYPALATRLIAAIAKPFENFDAGRLGVSIGVHQAAGSSLTQRLSCADEALYAAKAAGRNRYRLFDDSLSGRLAVRRDAERDLAAALTEGALDVWFQPIYRPEGLGLAGFEALVRWHHPRHGWVAPNELVAAAATAGLAEPLLRFILERTCAMMLSLRERGMDDVRVSMNVSPREMAQVPVDEIVLDRLRALSLPTAGFEVEITEETALDIAAVQDKLLALSRAGVRVALDDFGAGYSSLSCLRQLRAERIKIDRGLVTGLTHADDKRALVEAVLGIGRSLGLEVVAEGVETAEDLAALSALGCPFVQGYHLGRPMPHAAAVETLLTPRLRAA